MTHTEDVSPQYSPWICGCPDNPYQTFQCNGTCILNAECTFRCIQEGSVLVPGKTVAVLSYLANAGAYTFKWSADNIVSVTFSSRNPTVTKPFTGGPDLMTINWIYYELRHYPDTFTHSRLKRKGLTEAVARVRMFADSRGARDATLTHHVQNSAITDIGDGYSDVDDDTYGDKIHPWRDWQSDQIIATLSGPAPKRPLQTKVVLYRFKLAWDDTITISTHHEEVEEAWYKLAEHFKLGRDKRKDFLLVDIFCFLQTEFPLPVPPGEVAALKKCVYIIATEAVKRLQHPTWSVVRDRSPVLQCELHTFTACLRKEEEGQSEMRIQFWQDKLQAWVHGHLFQVMTTEKLTTVDLFITRAGNKEQTAPKYPIRQHMSELNEQGAYFCYPGLGYAGMILQLQFPLAIGPMHIS